MRVSMEEINTALAVMFGSDYIGDFMHNGQVRRVTVQADGKNRVDVEDVSRLHVRNAQGQMVPMSAFATLDWTMGPPQLNRYNGFPAFKINGSAAPGHSSGEAMRAMEQLASELPRGIGFAWSGQSYEESCPATRPTCCSRCPSWWCSWRWPRCMKAGPSRWR